MKSKQISITQIVRHLVQLAAFFLLPGLFISVFSALGSIVTSLVNGTFSFSALSAQLVTVLTVFLITALWGRFFCGFLCSFGAMQELIAFCSKKLFPHRHPLPKKLDSALKFIKYLLLAFFVVAVWILALPVGQAVSPWGVFGLIVSGNFASLSASIPTIGFVLLVVIVIGAVFVQRFFCRYLCPLGALFTLTSGKRLYKVRRKSSTCTSCGLCVKKCSMGIDILEKEAVTSGECIDCMQCLTACHNGSLSADPLPAISGTSAAIIMCGLVTVGNLTVPSKAVPTSYYADTSVKGTYKDGVYTGTGKGYRGDIKVQVTVKNGYLTEIDVLSNKDDLEFFNRAQSSVISEILSAQSINVSAVSGATFSSNGLINAVANALGTESQASTDFVPAADDQENEQINPDPDTSDGSQQPPNSNANDSNESSAALDLSTVADGTYQGSGTGFRGETKVSVTVNDGSITDISIESYADDDEFFNRAKNTIISDLIRTQSLSIQTVCGATFSSNGIIEAVANALNVTFSNPNQSNASSHGGHGGYGGHGSRGEQGQWR